MVPIEQIKVGDKVLSYNEKTKQFEYKAVATTFVGVKDNIVKLKVAGEKQLFTTTTEHPFYVRKAHKARDGLSAGGEDEDGKWTRILEITRDNQPTTVYNFEVEDNHSYFVGEIGVLSHNCSPITGILDWSITKASTGETRAAHIALHNVNNASKASHGVFFGDGVALTNEAWNIAVQQGLRRTTENGVDTVVVNMGRQIGVLGGVEGSEAPVFFNSVKLILQQGTNKLITAFPF